MAVALQIAFIGVLIAALIGLAAIVTMNGMRTYGSWSPVGALASWRRRVRRLRRYVEILRIIRVHGLSRALRSSRLETIDQETADAVVASLNEAGVTFIKMGQLLSTSREDLSPVFRRALSSLQTAAAPEPAGTIESIVEHELGITLQDVFTHFDPQPFAAASIAQVHAARMRDGRDVVVKVQRPDAAERVEVDGDILLRLARIAEARTPWAKNVGTVRIADDFVRAMKAETDYASETSNTRLLAAVLEHDDRVIVPRIVDELTSGTVMTMTRVSGAAMNTPQAGLERLGAQKRAELAGTLLRVVLNGILVDGVFHGDLHPGNINLTDDDRIGLLDFGAVGCLDAETRQLLTALLYAVSCDDNVAAVDALLMIANASDGVDVPSLRRDVGQVITTIRFRATLDVTLEDSLVSIVQDHGLSIPTQVIVALKSISAVERTPPALDPNLVILDASKDISGRILRQLVGPRRLATLATAQAAVMLVSARRIPQRIERTTAALADGTLSIHTRMLGNVGDRAWIQRMLGLVAGGALAIAAIVTAVVLIVADSGPAIAPNVPLSGVVALVLALFGVIVGLRTTARALSRR
jgi:ubiquinone biosynthesis protein